MTAFADSSALVKLYADEEGADAVRAIPSPVVARLARIEVPAALWRKSRTGELSARAAATLVAEFEADWFGLDGEAPRFPQVRLSALVMEDAARLAAVHGLRAYDAVQLASARAVRSADPSITTFAAFGRALRGAAAAEAFTLLP